MSKTDRRVLRTHQALMRAMIELILEKGLEATNVSEITERANGGRSTFYAHYADKHDLLQGGVDGLRRELELHVEAALRHPEPGVHLALAFCLPMLEHADENRALFAAMVGRKSGYLFAELAHDMWADIVRSNWDGADESAVQAIAGAFGAALSWWLSKPSRKLTAREVERRFVAAMEPAMC